MSSAMKPRIQSSRPSANKEADFRAPTIPNPEPRIPIATPRSQHPSALPLSLPLSLTHTHTHSLCLSCCRYSTPHPPNDLPFAFFSFPFLSVDPHPCPRPCPCVHRPTTIALQDTRTRILALCSCWLLYTRFATDPWPPSQQGQHGGVSLSVSLRSLGFGFRALDGWVRLLRGLRTMGCVAWQPLVARRVARIAVRVEV